MSNNFQQVVIFSIFSIYSANPFVPSVPFLFPLKTARNSKIFWCFQSVEKGCIENKRAKWDEKCTNRFTNLSSHLLWKVTFSLEPYAFSKPKFSEHFSIHCVKIGQIRSFFWSVFSPNEGKYRPEKTTLLHNFHVVIAYLCFQFST